MFFNITHELIFATLIILLLNTNNGLIFNYWIKKIHLLASLHNSGNNMIQLVSVDILKLKHLVTMATSQMEYNFRKGRTENGPGILIINKRFEFIINRANREKTTFWYYCKYTKTKGIQ